MKSRLSIILAAGALLGAEAAQDTAVKDVEKAVRALNEAFKKGDTATIKALMSEDHVAITPYYGGPQNAAEQLKSLPDLKLSEYTMSQVKVSALAKDSVLVTYALTQKGTYKGKDVAPRSYASSLWMQRGGKWLEVFYQETALP